MDWKTLIPYLIATIVVYLLWGLFLFLTQKSMIYFPANQDFNNCPDFKDYEQINHKGTRFYFKNVSDEVIVHYHGNAGSVCDRSFSKEIFESSNRSVIFVEYAGYSNDTKKPSKDLILQDVENIKDFIKDFKKVIAYGESVGSGAACYHASLGNVNSLVLVAPFSTLQSLVQSKYMIYPANLLLREKYDNIEYLKNYKGNVLIFHGDKDTIIPKRFSKALFDEITTKKEYVLIEGKGHNDLWNSNVFKNKLKEFLK